MSNTQLQCLIADDVRASRELAKAWMEEFGFGCGTAENGREAWRAVLHSPPDLVLTDLEMPIESGLNLLHSIKSDEATAIRRIPVIVMTSLNDDRLVEVVNDMGASVVIQKPIDKVELRNAVNRSRENVGGDVETHLPDLTPSGPCGRVSPALRRLLAEIRVIES